MTDHAMDIQKQYGEKLMDLQMKRAQRRKLVARDLKAKLKTPIPKAYGGAYGPAQGRRFNSITSRRLPESRGTKNRIKKIAGL